MSTNCARPRRSSRTAPDDEIPDDLWSRIEDQLSAPPPPLRLVAVTQRDSDAAAGAGHRTRHPWAWGIAAALALVIAVSVGAVAVQRNSDQDARLDAISTRMEHEQMREAAFDAAMEPDSRVAALAATNGTVKAKVVTTTDGRGYFMRDQLPALAAGRTYQLWALMDNATNPTMISVGVLGRNPTVSAFTAAGEVMGYAVTEEASPGVGSSTQPMMLKGMFS